jgi:hypothetical protein
MALAKASLQALTGAANPTVDGTPFDVQFNPATLRLQMTNNVEGGEARHRTAQQYTGSSSTTLTLELHFDSADQRSNVRAKSAIVRRFVTPATGATKQAPPRVRFHWGDFVFIGVVTSVNEDIDLFSADGMPLHSKCNVTIKEQDPRFAALSMGAGAAQGANAVPAGESAAPSGGDPAGGGGPGGPTDRTAAAIGGESAAEFTARMGLDPSAWRGLAPAGGSPLSLPAGLEIDFSSGLSSAPGVGVSSGVESGASASTEAALGLAPAPGGAAKQGLALAAAGGVGAALQTAQIAKASAAAAQARDAFGVPPAPAPPSAGGAPAPAAAATAASQAAAPGPSSGAAPSVRPAPPAQPRPSLAAGGLPGPAAQAAAAPAPPPPVADPRATGFGFGVPLRPTVGGAAQARAAVVHGWLAPRTVASQLPDDPTRPRWSLTVPNELLDTVPAAAPAHADCGCGCGGCG